MYYDKHTVKRYKISYLIVGVILGMTCMWTSVKAYTLTNEIKEYHAIKANVELTKEATKVKQFVQSNNNKIWDKLAEEMALAYVQASKKYKVPLEILVGKDVVESQFHIFARSKTGAAGVGQLDHSAWKDVLPQGNPYDPTYNIESCAAVMSHYIKKYGFRKGIEMYNVGDGNYAKGIRNKAYVSKVLSAASEYRYFKGE